MLSSQNLPEQAEVTLNSHYNKSQVCGFKEKSEWEYRAKINV